MVLFNSKSSINFFRSIWIHMLCIYHHYKYLFLFQCGHCLYTSESDVYWRQILTYKIGRGVEGVKLAYISAHILHKYKLFLPLQAVGRGSETQLHRVEI